MAITNILPDLDDFGKTWRLDSGAKTACFPTRRGLKCGNRPHHKPDSVVIPRRVRCMDENRGWIGWPGNSSLRGKPSEFSQPWLRRFRRRSAPATLSAQTKTRLDSMAGRGACPPVPFFQTAAKMASQPSIPSPRIHRRAPVPVRIIQR